MFWLIFLMAAATPLAWLTGQLQAPDLQAFPSLVQALADDEELDRAVAVQTLYARPRPARDAPLLAKALKHSTKARVAAAWELSRIGPSMGGAATRSLIEALQYPDKHERNFVVLALAAAGPPREAIGGLLAVLNDAGSADPPQKDYRYPRATAALALGMIGPDAREAIPALAGLFAGADFEYQRATAGWALERITARPAESARESNGADLTRMLSIGPSPANSRIVDGLRALGEFAGASKPIRKKGSGKSAPPVHESITLAIGYLDSLAQPPSPDEIAAQEKAGNLSDDARRYVMALGGVQQNISGVLLESLVRGDRNPRVIAARRLADLGPASKDAIPALRAASSDTDWIVRREAYLALRRIEAPASHIYKTLGERKLQIAMHYPTGWKREDRRIAVLFFSGAHKVQPDKDGKLPPLAAERAKLGLPVVNRGPGESHAPFCDSFAQRGYVCMRVEYRTRGKDGVLPGDDIAAAFNAMGWVRGHAAELGIDPKRIVAAGGSSGAYLAASLFAFESQHFAARPNAIILYSPLVDWLEVGSMSESFLVVLGGDKALGARISPARHWRKDSPPTLVMVGTKEPPFATVKEFADKWRAAGAAIEIYVAEGANHGFFAQPARAEKTAARTDQFLHSLWGRP